MAGHRGAGSCRLLDTSLPWGTEACAVRGRMGRALPTRSEGVARAFHRPRLLTPDGLDELRAETQRLVAIARRRDFAMSCMDNSPRHMTTLGGHVIARESSLVRELYGDPRLLGLVGAVAGEPPLAVPDPLERHVLNVLHR
ncbi:HalD/BesD family halogenase [Streptomyces sp. NPDC002784]